MVFIIIVLWGLVAFPLIQEYAEESEQLSRAQIAAVCFILLIGAPAFGIVNFFSSLLDIIERNNE